MELLQQIAPRLPFVNFDQVIFVRIVKGIDRLIGQQVTVGTEKYFGTAVGMVQVPLYRQQFMHDLKSDESFACSGSQGSARSAFVVGDGFNGLVHCDFLIIQGYCSAGQVKWDNKQLCLERIQVFDRSMKKGFGSGKVGDVIAGSRF